jgi:hypothetical protein
MNLFSILLFFAILLANVMGTSHAASDCQCPCTKSLTGQHDGGSSFVAVPTATYSTAASLANAQAMIHTYIVGQLNQHHLTANEFKALPVDMQRRVMTPGATPQLTREYRHTILTMKRTVPSRIVEQLNPQQVLPADVLEEYAVALPASLNAAAAKANTLFIIGDALVETQTDGRIVRVQREAL